MRNKLSVGLILAMCLAGCGSSGPVNPVPPVPTTDTTTPPTPSTNTTVVPVNNQPDPSKVLLITGAAQSAVGLAMLAIPAAEAVTVAAQASQVIEQSVLPTLQGSNSGIGATIQDILGLSAFNAPALAKVKLILSSLLPMALAELPPNLVSGPISQLPPNVLAYITAFFTGADNGLKNYVADAVVPTPPTPAAAQKTGMTYSQLRHLLTGQ